MSRGKRGGGQVEFINAARNNLQAFGVHKDLDVYKELLKVFPEGDLVPENAIQVDFYLFFNYNIK
jgi:evolutionarily conserved signaling intermediate in Toll pathway